MSPLFAASLLFAEGPATAPPREVGPPQNAAVTVQDAPAPQAATGKVLILPFTPLKPVESEGWIGRSVQQSLVADLMLVSPDHVTASESPVDTPEAAQAAGQKAGAQQVVFGHYQTTPASAIRVTGQIIDVPTGQTIAGLRATGTTSNIFTVEDAIAAQVRQRLFPKTPAPMARAPDDARREVEIGSGETYSPALPVTARRDTPIPTRRRISTSRAIRAAATTRPTAVHTSTAIPTTPPTTPTTIHTGTRAPPSSSASAISITIIMTETEATAETATETGTTAGTAADADSPTDLAAEPARSTPAASAESPASREAADSAEALASAETVDSAAAPAAAVFTVVEAASPAAAHREAAPAAPDTANRNKEVPPGRRAHRHRHFGGETASNSRGEPGRPAAAQHSLSLQRKRRRLSPVEYTGRSAGRRRADAGGVQAFRTLAPWRTWIARERQLSPYCICHDATLK